MIIYCLYFPNGKRYVGKIGKQGKTIQARKYEHFIEKTNNPVCLALNKYGLENVRHRTLFTTDDVKVLNIMERHYIVKLKSSVRENGYNVAKGGDGGDLWNCLSEDRQEVLRQRAKERLEEQINRLTPKERKKRLSRPGELNAMYGKSHTETAKEKIREARARQIFTKEHRAILSAAQTKRKQRESKFTKTQWLLIRKEITRTNNRLKIPDAASKYGVSIRTMEELSRGAHWSCRG